MPLALGWLIVALVGVLVLTTQMPERLPTATRALVYFYATTNVLALGLLTGCIADAWFRWGAPIRAALVTLTLAASYLVLSDDLVGPARRWPAQVPFLVSHLALVLLASLLIPLAWAVGTRLARPWLRTLGVTGGITAATLNGIYYVQNYQGIHLLIVVVAAVLIGTSLKGGTPASWDTPRALPVRASLIAVAAVLGATSVAVGPRSSVAVVLSSQPGAVLFPFLGRLYDEPESVAFVPAGQIEWFMNRSSVPAIPATTPTVLPVDPIVILLGIDSMRADLLANEKYRATFPELFRLRDESSYFADARAPGPSTAPSLAAIFAGVYYSQLYWTKLDVDPGMVYPHEDHSPRFPELLLRAGVTTATFDSSGWLLNARGVVKGFAEEQSLRKNGEEYATAKELLAATLERIGSHKGGPLFVFLHLLDTHAPYTSGGVKKTAFEGYLAEFGVLDAELRRMRETLESNKLMDRTCLILMGDHGEAFGEHGLTWHATSLYDELLRVPLLIKLPSGKPRVVTDPVSLIDLGPTILDLMGVATPGHYMGQSLTGYLRGAQPKLTRPIIAEGRLMHSLVLPNGIKVIHDTRNHGVEIFDLRHDAREESNLYDNASSEGIAGLRALQTFFRTHTYQKDNYQVPFRRW